MEAFEGAGEMSVGESRIILYTTDDGKATVSLMSRDGRIWLNQKQMAELFAVSKPNISMLVSKIFAEKELDGSVVKQYLTTAPAAPRTHSPFQCPPKAGFNAFQCFLSGAR